MRKMIFSLVIGAACAVTIGCSHCGKQRYAEQTFSPVEDEVTVTASAEQRTPVAQTVHFGFDSDKLTSEDEAMLDQLAMVMQNNPNATIKVDGFTDVRGPHRYNEKLGMRRAQSVVSYLTAKGIDAHRFDVASYGPDKTVDLSETEVAHARNRRVEVFMEVESQLS